MSADFVLALHSHLPWVLNHGRWPHGSDWLTEAVLDTYLPIIESLQALERDRVPAPITLGVTPVLANQLVHPRFRGEVEAFFDQRLEACRAAPESLRETNDARLIPLAGFWRARYERLRALFQALDGDLIGALRSLESRGRLEIIGSAATHGFLPLFARDETVRLQLAVGVREHRRLFGRSPAGCWLPECAYRPRERWAPWPTAPAASIRRGIDEHVADAGYRYFFVDAHLVTGARPLSVASEGTQGLSMAEAATSLLSTERSPYRAWRVSPPGKGSGVAVFARDPKASSQVWSRHGGYPGDGAYLDFHKIRWPGGLKYWRVTDPDIDLSGKEPYDPPSAAARANVHAAHFGRLVDALAGDEPRKSAAVLAAPFDTELFGHWWFEGPHFLEEMYRALPGHPDVLATTASAHLERHRPAGTIRLPAGSWGANGNYGMWLNDQTSWTWERLWSLEEAYWEVAPLALTQPAARPVLEQATREFLLAQSSDWQFMISTGAVTDYAVRRFSGHCDDAERLVAALRPGREADLPAALRLAGECRERNDLFPDLLPAVDAACSGSRALALD